MLEEAKYCVDNADTIKAIKTAQRKKRKVLQQKERRAFGKEYVVISGKQKRVKYPDKIIDVLSERFTVSGCSETGLKWSDSAINKSWLRGQEAGYPSSDGYFFVTIVIDLVTYAIQVANVVWMLTHKQQIKDGEIIDHINHNRRDNRIENLKSGDYLHNAINCSHKKSYGYPNISIKKFANFKKIYFVARFSCSGSNWSSKYVQSQDHAFVLGWEILTSGQIPLNYIKSKSLEFLDGTYLKEALAECAKQGITIASLK